MHRRARVLAAVCLLLAAPVYAGDPWGLRTPVLDGDHAALAAALAAGADPNARLPDGSRALAWAAELQDSAAVRLLLEHGADPDDDEPGANAFTPLLVACLHPEAGVLSALLDAGADVRAQSEDGVSVLAACAGHAPTAIVQQMIELGAEVDGALAQTPLMWAAAHGRRETFDALLARGADLERQTPQGFTALFFAIKRGEAAMAEHVVAKGADLRHVCADGTTALQLALYQDNLDFARALVGSAPAAFDLARRDLNGRTPLHVAARSGDVELVRALLSAGVDIDALTGPSQIQWRYESNFRAGTYDWPIVPASFLAAAAGQTAALTALIEAGADVRWTDADGDSLLHAAVASANVRTVEAVLAIAPDANVIGARGQTPLHRALKRVDGAELDAILGALARHGARVDVLDDAGESPAMIAADEHFKARARFAALFEQDEESGP